MSYPSSLTLARSSGSSVAPAEVGSDPRPPVHHDIELQPLQVDKSPEEKFREFLAIRGEKLTAPRRALVRHVFNAHKHFDADELTAELQERGEKVSRSTVYRTLRLLVEAGLLRELRLTNRTAYEHDYGYPSHDHLHCSECGTIVEFSNEDIRNLREAISRSHGFRASGHKFIITGICEACRRLRNNRRRPII
ncbi:ferric uptake regulator, Fur family [Isosphaera pallida ATCC 43644]|jgi:Fur family ferric uptake transcriptional regulator|uniref:Ferric uptake regulation protein n=1 Tax=Isosphaera pallida (strain ATCC 43644 / DSM 9630 / IS1B) TaxID=575540 RepID=E8R337_ISOPI|nr:Fur family transcriptional regulator [Isosphaera pallida]ADV62556.1 ferric uptake regulator, Fur family [Isosphaera pallida ATCC 43644]